MGVDRSSFWKAIGVSFCPEVKLPKVVAWVEEVLRSGEARIIKAFYGLAEEKKTASHIGQGFGVTDERIRQIRDRAIRKLRKSHKQRVKLWRHKIRADRKEG